MNEPECSKGTSNGGVNAWCTGATYCPRARELSLRHVSSVRVLPLRSLIIMDTNQLVLVCGLLYRVYLPDTTW